MTVPPRNLSAGNKALPPDEAGDDARLTDFLAPPQADDELGRLGEYRILKILGHGGMGVVFQAEDPKLSRKVALKAMLPNLADSDGCPDSAFCVKPRPRPPSSTITSSPSTRSARTAAFPSSPCRSSRASRSTNGCKRDEQAAGQRKCCASAGKSPRPGRRPHERADPPRHQAGQHLAGGRDGSASRSSTSAWPAPPRTGCAA